MSRQVISVVSTLLAAAVVSAGGLAGVANAAIAPYANNFDASGATPSGFTENADADWSVVSSGGGQGYRVNVTRTTSSGNTAPAASLSFTDPLTTTWTLQADVKLAAFTSNSTVGSTTRLGFGALGSAAGFTATPFYLMDWVVAPGVGGVPVPNGSLRILESGGNEVTPVLSTGAALIPNAVDTFRMAVTAVPNGPAGIRLTYMVTNLTTSNFVTVTANYNTALTGSHFGFRNSVATPGSSSPSVLDATFDNLVVVPEPALLASLMAAGMMTAMGRSRFRRRS